MQKRGQVSAQALLMILGGIIVVMILIVGYGFITKAKKSADDTEFVQLKNKIANDISTIGKDYGSFRKVSYRVPRQVEQVCMVDWANKDTALLSKTLEQYPKIKDSLSSGAKQNLFYVGDVSRSADFIPGISLNRVPFFKCFKNLEGKIEFGLEGKGDSTLLIADFKASVVPSTTERTELASPDDIITLLIPVQVNPLNEVSIEMVGLGQGSSDVYEFEPKNVAFNPPIELLIKPADWPQPDCATTPYSYPLTFVKEGATDDLNGACPGETANAICYKSEPLECDDTVAVFKINKFI